MKLVRTALVLTSTVELALEKRIPRAAPVQGVATTLGCFVPVAWVTWYPFPDLSCHVATACPAEALEPPEVRVVLASAASSQSLKFVPDSTVAGYGTALALLDAGPVPAALVAVTVTVYVVPLVRPVIVQPVVAVEQVAPPGDAVAV
jgi:hypothetical protein